MLDAFRNSRRLGMILLILAREDALFILEDLGVFPLAYTFIRIFRKRRLHQRKGKRLAAALERLGPAFIKLGQTLSTRSDLIGDELAADLSDLRNNLPPFPSAVAKEIIHEQFQAPVQALFASFGEKPVAAASIAQVHRAVTLDGRAVAVKILRPHIEEAFERDLALFNWLAEIIERRFQGWRRLKPREVVKTFRESVFFELDLRFEAAAATELAGNMKRHEPGFRVPAVDWNLTTRRVLTTEWVEGIPMGDIAAIHASGLDPDAILAKSARGLFCQVFKDGFFHADLHPGNLFVDAKGDLVAVDFGIMGRLDMASRIYIADILRGFIEEDYRHVAQVHFDAGYVPADKSIELFTQACMAVAKPIVGKPLKEISVATLLGQMFKIAAEFEMETQPQLLLLQKTMMVTEGVGRMLNPNLNTWELAAPLIEEWAREQFGVTGKIKSGARETHAALRKLPGMLLQVEQALKNIGGSGGVRIHPVSIEAINAGRRHVLGRWLVFAWTALGVGVIMGMMALL